MSPFTNSLCLFAGSLSRSGSSVKGMNDVMFVAVSILFFVVSIGYVVACDRLMK